jgi:hypothetical protein
MISIWFILPVFAAGYFLGWRRGEFVGATVAFAKATEQANKAIREFKARYLSGDKSE